MAGGAGVSCPDVKSWSLPVMEPGRLTGAGEKPGRQPQSHGAAGGFLLKSFMARKGQYVSPYPPHGDRGPRRRWADRAGERSAREGSRERRAHLAALEKTERCVP